MYRSLTTLIAALMLCNSASAFSFSGLKSSSKSSTSSTISNVVNAVSSGNSVVSTVASALWGDAAITPSSIAGEWTYHNPSVLLQSDNTLTEAAGNLATSQIEGKISSTFSKVGINAGSFTFVFNSDNTFSCTVGKRTLSGTYVIDGEEKLTLTFSALGAINLGTMTTIAYRSGANLSLLFQADKLLDLVSALTSVAKNNVTLASANALLSNYNGVRVGFEMTK